MDLALRPGKKAKNSLFQGQAFQFGFDTTNQGHAQGTCERAENEVVQVTRVHVNVDVLDWFRDNHGLCIPASKYGFNWTNESVVQIDWTLSSSYEFHVTPILKYGADSQLIAPNQISLIPSQSITGNMLDLTIAFRNDAELLEIDCARTNPSSHLKRMHYSRRPLIIDSDLQSWTWPILADNFISDHWKCNRSLIVHSGVERSCEILSKFGLKLDSSTNYNIDVAVKSILSSSTNTIIWMVDEDNQQMQYVDASNTPETAWASFRSGHSLYINPCMEFQRDLIAPIQSSLGLVPLIADTTAHLHAIGGDVEVFAVRKAHKTAWHWDSQHNITIQLIGVKRWQIRHGLPHLRNPLTNWHPQSSNCDTRRSDAAVHRLERMSVDNLKSPFIDDDDDEKIRGFELRPGSIMYLPAGSWHRVDCDGNSLSINLSFDGMRWIDVLQRRILPKLTWSDNVWRQFVVNEDCGDIGALPLKQRLMALSQKLAELANDDFAIESILRGIQPQTDIEDASKTLKCNQFIQLSVVPDDNQAILSVGGGRSIASNNNSIPIGSFVVDQINTFYFVEADRKFLNAVSQALKLSFDRSLVVIDMSSNLIETMQFDLTESRDKIIAELCRNGYFCKTS